MSDEQCARYALCRYCISVPESLDQVHVPPWDGQLRLTEQPSDLLLIPHPFSASSDLDFAQRCLSRILKKRKLEITEPGRVR